MLVAYGYIYPLQDHKKLVLKPDGSLYRFQVTVIGEPVLLKCYNKGLKIILVTSFFFYIDPLFLACAELEG